MAFSCVLSFFLSTHSIDCAVPLLLSIHVLTLEVTNDNFHGVHRLELYIVAFFKNHCIANTGLKNINKKPLCC